MVVAREHAAEVRERLIRTTRGYQDVGDELTRRAAAAMEAGIFGSDQPRPAAGNLATVTDLVTERRRLRSS